MSLLTNFYFLSLFFIIFEIYQLSNRDVFYINPIDINNPIKYILFYLTRIFYSLWIPIGLFTDLKTYFLLILILGFIKMIFVSIKNIKIIAIYDIFGVVLRVFFLSIIFRLGVFR